MSQEQVRVVESWLDVPDFVKARVRELLKGEDRVKLPLVIEASGYTVRLGFREIAAAVREYWWEIARAHGVEAFRDPVALVEYWDDDRYTLKAVLPCSFYVELTLVNYDDEAELFVHFNKWM